MSTIAGDDQTTAVTQNQGGVTVKIIDSTGKELMKFPATEKGSLVEDAQKAGFEIPTSCGAGACFVCAGRVKQGEDCIDIGKIGVPLVDLEHDQVLMCVGGIKKECVLGTEAKEVIIEKDI